MVSFMKAFIALAPSRTSRTSLVASAMLSTKATERGGVEKRKVAVIGAGAAGMAASVALREEGHEVVAFERAPGVGGTWRYSDSVENEDLMGVKGSRSRVPGSMYRGLRTNLPREVMGFIGFPFRGGDVDGRRFCSHEEVQNYLESYASHNNVHDMVQYGCTVSSAVPLTASGEQWTAQPGNSPPSTWELLVHRSDAQDGKSLNMTERHSFDALVVCNGHYSEPRLPDSPGLLSFQGKVRMHSHNYRSPAQFEGLKKVLMVGHGYSGEDISREIATVVDEVHICARREEGFDRAPYGERQNIFRHGPLSSLSSLGTAEIDEGAGGKSFLSDVDGMCLTTGYKYHFPFLNEDIVKVVENRVEHVYEHVWAPALAPTLAFIGLPWKVVPFPLSQLQATWVAKVLSGAVALPSRIEMESALSCYYKSMEKEGIARRFTHRMGQAQFSYLDKICLECGLPPREAWWQNMYTATSASRREYKNLYRDNQSPYDGLLEEMKTSLDAEVKNGFPLSIHQIH